MRANEYQTRAMSTRLPSCENATYMLFGLMAEVGEIADKIAKWRRNWFCRQNKPNRYDVVHDIVCSRCRRVHRTILKSRISRAQLLHDGWFIIDE